MEEEGEYSVSEGSHEDDEDSKSEPMIAKKEKSSSFRFFNADEDTETKVSEQKKNSTSFSVFSETESKETVLYDE